MYIYIHISCTSCSTVVFFLTGPLARAANCDTRGDTCVTPGAIRSTLACPGAKFFRLVIDFGPIKNNLFWGIPPKQQKKQSRSTPVRPISAKVSKN